MQITIHQVNADGAGPYTCDADPTGGTLNATGQTPLEVTNNVPGANGFSEAKTIDFNMTITFPPGLICIGGPFKNICIIRCRNNSLAGPFGGCVAVEQLDGGSGAKNAATGSKAAGNTGKAATKNNANAAKGNGGNN